MVRWLAVVAVVGSAGGPREPVAPLEVAAPAPAQQAVSPAPPAPTADGLSPETGEANLDLSAGTAPPAPRHAPIGRLPGYVGLGAGVGLSTRTVGDDGVQTAVTGYGAVHGRLAGYARRKARRGRKVVVMLLPEVQVDLELGGTAAAAPTRHGVMLGASGVFNLGVGFASPGRVGVYAQVEAGQRFRARLHDDLEGAHYLASPGLTAGLRVDGAHTTLLAGGGVDGVIGAQRGLVGSTLVAQLAPVAQLALFGEPRDVYVGVLGRFDATALGQRHGGTRLHGRATAEVMWRVLRVPGIRLATLLLTYEGTRVSAAPGHPQFDPRGERRASHQWLLAGGLTF